MCELELDHGLLVCMLWPMTSDGPIKLYPHKRSTDSDVLGRMGV